ncbi:hypothetical protein EV130_112243 [Rhizobium azibense]|uniref:Uncharacterized protein n=1 Tax=Rhizobium azibense TaxID=1136135 RepID=A0A4R3QGI0_9HYPH|nr:hypothetical protein EV130_112243 [Rhizobium azibense]
MPEFGFYNIGFGTVIITLLSLLFYIRGLVVRVNHTILNFFAAIFIGAVVSSLAFYTIAPTHPLRLFAAQCLAATIYYMLLKLAFSRATVGSRPLFVSSDQKRENLIALCAVSPLVIIIFDYLTPDLNQSCTRARCYLLDLLFGRDQNFQYYYIANLLGIIIIAIFVLSLFNLVKRGQ